MLTLLADNDFGDDLGDGVAGPLGLLIIVLLVIAVVFLIRDMNKRLRRLQGRQSFDDPIDGRSVDGRPLDDRPADPDHPDLLRVDRATDPGDAGTAG